MWEDFPESQRRVWLRRVYVGSLHVASTPRGRVTTACGRTDESREMFAMNCVRQRLFALLVTLMVTSGGILATSSVASAEDSNIYDKRIVSAQSGLCLNLSQWDTSGGAVIIQWSCDYNRRQNNERWDLIEPLWDPTSPDWFIKNRHSKKCLDIIATWNGSRVTQQGCYAGNQGRQVWYMESKDGPNDGWHYFTLRNLNTDKCLDVPQGTTDKGAVIQLWDCNGSRAQLWRIRF